MTTIPELESRVNNLIAEIGKVNAAIASLMDRINSAGDAAVSVAQAMGASASDHGALTGLSDDDHTQYVHKDTARSITAQHAFAPSSTQAPFTLGANAQGQLVTGLNADKLDGLEASAFEVLAAQNANKVHAGPTSGGDANPTYRYMVENDLAAHNIVGAAHTVAGSTDQLVGLTATSTLGLLTPSSSPGAAKAILKTTAAGLLTLEDLDITDTLDVGGAMEVTGIGTFLDDLIVNTDTLFVDQSQDNVGIGKLPTAGWDLDVAGAMRTGGLATLASLDVTGAADFNDDLTVGANIFFVDYSGERVGIRMAPDPQFQLDILGNLRVSGYIVGKHAIQLEGAIGIFHFDGALPFETDFTGVTTGHKGQTPLTEDNIIFREGKFGKAVQLAIATTNLVLNPSFEDGLNNWTTWDSPPTLEVVTTDSYVGPTCAHLVTDTPGIGQGIKAYIAVTSTQNYTLSAYFKVGSGQPTISAIGGSVDIDEEAPVEWAGDGEWHRLILNFTADTSPIDIRIGKRSGAGAVGEYWIDGIQLEQTDSVTPYCDGGMGSGHSWSGTAHSSTSSRVASELEYNTSLFRELGGTFMCWVLLPGDDDLVNDHYILDIPGSTGVIRLRVSSAFPTKARFRFGANEQYSTAVVNDGSWHHLAITWDGEDASLYIDGELDYTLSSYAFDTATSLHVGSHNSGVNQGNCLIDEVVFLNRVSDADEIRSVYESDAPVFAETSTFEWHTPSVTTWVDEEGLWSRGVSGQEVFGISDVNTKSWAGLTLDEGDVVIGNYPDFLWWDDSNSRLVLTGELIATRGNLLGGAIFSESFEDISTLDWWEQHEGPDELSIASGGTFGGSILQGGDNSGDDMIRISHTTNIPYDPSKTYKMSIRARRTAGSGTLYAGFMGVAADGVTLVDRNGADNYTLAHYIAAQAQTPASWTVFEGWITGNAATGTSGTVDDPTSPGTMHEDARYFRPQVLINHNGQPGTFEIDAVIVEVTPEGNDLTSIDGGRITANTVDTNQLVADAIDGMTITGATIRTSSSGARVQMDATSIFGTDGSTVQWQALNADGKLTAGGGDVELTEDGINIVNNSNHIRFLVAGSAETAGYILNDTVLGRVRNRSTNNPSSPINYTIIEALTATGVGGSPSYPGRLALVGENLVVVSADVGVAAPTANGTLQTGDFVANGSLGGSWTSLSYGTSWADYGGAWTSGEYKKHGDLVFLRGLVDSGAGAWATYPVIATLPTGYRPTAGDVAIDTVCQGEKTMRLRISTGGVISISGHDSGSGSGWVSLNSIVFSID